MVEFNTEIPELDIFRHQPNLFHPNTEEGDHLGFVKEVNISHIDSDPEEEAEWAESKQFSP